MNIIDLIIGGVLGVLLNEIFSRNYEKIKKVIRLKKIKKRQLLLESGKVGKWLIDYYSKKGSLDDLFNCKIGGRQIKIPFFSKSNWQFIKEIDSKDDNFLKYDGSNENEFEIDKRLINSRKKLGQRLFDGPVIFFDRLEEPFKGSPTIHIKNCNFYQMVTSLVRLEEETFKAVRKNSFKRIPIRNKYFSNIINLYKPSEKPFSVGCVTLFAIKTKDSYEIIIQKRSHSTVTTGGTKAGIPSFVLTPIVSTNENHNIIFYNFIKEYCEELFNYDELIDLSISKRNYPFWFYELPEAKKIFKLMKDRNFSIEILGFGFNALNGDLSIALLAIINDPKFSTILKKEIIANWEVAKRTLKQEPIEFIDYKSSDLESWLIENKFNFSTAFALCRAIERLDFILSK